MRIAVAGDTGLVGRHTTAALQAAGHDAVVLARSTGIDVTTGSGLDAALAGGYEVSTLRLGQDLIELSRASSGLATNACGIRSI